MPLVYDELRRLAHHYFRQERSDHTLQSTALVHEAHFRLAGQNPPQWQNRAHLFGIGAHIMPQILVEYARGRGRSEAGRKLCLLKTSNNREMNDFQVFPLETVR